MTTDRVQRSRDLFAAAMELPEAERTRYLRAECAGDDELLGELESLLSYHDSGRDFMERPAARDPGVTGVVEPKPGTRIGRFRILRTIGEGGMGVVYAAQQDSPRRTVALKVLRPGLVSPSLLKRFAQEATALGLLKHPGIAQIYEAGTDGASARPYLAMEFVEGEPVTHHAAKHKLGTRQRIDLFIKICDAVQHAHEQAVIHRDLKPANILVDDTGQPKILDFGVARIADARLTVTTIRTDVGQLLGTISYMSPEQASGQAEMIDARSDIYALGVILYELLAGRPPLDLTNRPVLAAVKAIRDQDPTPLSAISRVFKGDIDTIVRKALEKEPRLRYRSVAALADDLRRYLRDQPIVARPPSKAYQLRKFARRNRPLVAGVCAAFVTLAVGLAATSWQAVRATRQRNRAVEAEGVADAARRRADENAESLRRNLYFNRIGYAQTAHGAGDAERMRALLAECPEDLRGWEWRYLARLADASSDVAQISQGIHHAAACRARGSDRLMTFSTSVKADSARLLEESTGTVIAAYEDPDRILAARPALSPDGHLVAVARDKTEFAVLDAATGRAVWQSRASARPWACMFDDAGERLLTATATEWTLRDASTGRPLLEFKDPILAPLVAAFSHSGDLLAVANSYDCVGLWDTRTGAHLTNLRDQKVNHFSVAFGPDDSRLVASSQESCTVWDVSTGEMLWHVQPCGPRAIHHATFSPDMSMIAAAGADTTIRLLDAASGEPLRILRGHSGEVTFVDFLADGRSLVSFSLDGTLRWWREPLAEDSDRLWIWDHWVRALAFSGDGRHIYSATTHGIDVWDARTRRRVDRISGKTSDIRAVSVCPSRGLLALGARSGVVEVYKPDANARLARWVTRGSPVWAVSIDPTGRRVAAAWNDRTIRIYDVDTAAEVRSIACPRAALSLQWLPEGRIVSAHHDGIVCIWDAQSGDAIQSLVAHPDGAFSVAVSPDASRIITSGQDDIVKVWNSGLSECLLSLKGHKRHAYALAVSPDGTRLATGGYDSVTKLWDLATGEELLTLAGHTFGVISAAFSPDGTIIATGGDSVRLWDSNPRPQTRTDLTGTLIGAPDGTMATEGENPPPRS